MPDHREEDARTKASLRGELDEVKIIASGGMSLIFRARQPSLERYIVVKKLKDELLFNSDTVERFRREAKALASILHQNVAHVYDFVENGKESYILMEYIEGMDLSQVIEKVGNLPPEVAVAILLAVSRGVSCLHSHNLIHRDIKPSNIRLTTRGEVKLMDFGIVMDIRNEGLTRPGMMVGSPSYLSPEQVLGDSITPRADIFLLGICLYEMLTGTRPFKEENGQTVFQRIREGEHVPVREMQRNVSKHLSKIVDKCLMKNPDARYEDPRDLIMELEDYLGPEKSAHTEDIILKYLDDEALLNPSVVYRDMGERTQKWGRFLPHWAALPLVSVLLGLSFYVGLRMGKQHGAATVVPQEVQLPGLNGKPSPRGHLKKK